MKKLVVEQYMQKEWAALSEKAHLVLFGENRQAKDDRIDFTLLARDEDIRLCGYVTCREHDRTTLYWQYGGVFPGVRDAALMSWRIHEAGIQWCRGKYKRITTVISNKNTVMLKMAMKAGFEIVGLRYYGGAVLLEHVLELEA